MHEDQEMSKKVDGENEGEIRLIGGEIEMRELSFNDENKKARKLNIWWNKLEMEVAGWSKVILV